jgi:hypothetical protein
LDPDNKELTVNWFLKQVKQQKNSFKSIMSDFKVKTKKPTKPLPFKFLIPSR